MDATLDVPSFESYLELKNKVRQLEKKLRHARTEISHLKARLNTKKGESKKLKIIKLIDSGVCVQEIVKTHGFNLNYVYEVSQYYRRVTSELRNNRPSANL